MSQTLGVPLSRFKEILDEYNDLVKQGNYPKMDYELWRTMNHFDSAFIHCICDERTYTISVTGSSALCAAKTLRFRYGGEPYILGFGFYLYGKLFSPYSNKTININSKNKNEKEIDDNMKNFNFEFGPCTDNLVRVSMYGLAIKNTAGTWVSYNTKDNSIVDVDVFSFDNMGKFIYKIPVAVKDVAVGDVVIHNRVPMFVEECTDEEHFVVVDVRSGERKEIIPTKNMLGFNFITKVVSLFNAVGNAPTPDAPFGNMLPFLMMDDDNKDINPMMLMLMAQSQGGNFGDIMNNPMMLYCMMKNEDNDILPWFFMMNNFKG